MSHAAPQPNRNWRLDWVTWLWLAFLVLAIIVAIKCLPGSLRNTRDGDGFNPSDAASLNAALAKVNLSLLRVGLVQLSLTVLLQAISIAIGWLLLRSPVRNRFTILFAFVIVATIAATYPPDIPDLLPGQPVWQALTLGITMASVIGLFILPLLFPSGRFAGRWVIPCIVLAGSASFLLERIPQHLLNQPVVEAFNISLGLVVLATIAASLVINFRKAPTERERQQFKWVAFGMILSIPAFFLGDFMLRHIGPGAFGISCLFGFTLLMPLAFFIPTLAIGISILRYQLFDIDLVLSQTLIWITLSTSVTAAYVAIVLGIGHLLGENFSLVLSVLTTGLVAIAFQPASVRIRVLVRRLVYGARDEPYTAMAKLGSRIESTSSSEDLLPAIVRTMVEALSLPYAALFLDSPSGPQLAATAGIPTTFALNLPLTHGGRQIGTLAVGERGPGSTFNQSDRALLENLARQIGVAATTVSLTNALQQSRERIVIAREEERRRLRRDLHDGLGAHLAGLIMQTGSLRSTMHRDLAAADTEIDQFRIELRQAIQDVRRLVAGLRPPSLDELGLIGAMQERLQRFDTGGIDAAELGMRVTFRPPASLPPLSAAAEVALFRIAEEAMTNVVKHAQATETIVSLRITDGTIELRIHDNGIGMTAVSSDGIGLGSMQNRAEELGGTVTITNNAPESGTTVTAHIPYTGLPV